MFLGYYIDDVSILNNKNETYFKYPNIGDKIVIKIYNDKLQEFIPTLYEFVPPVNSESDSKDYKTNKYLDDMLSNKDSGRWKEVGILYPYNCMVFGNDSNKKFQNFVKNEAEMWKDLAKDYEKHKGVTKRFKK